ncbi:MAG: anhydro-N-acetylmuramic acid kinase [Flavobacteriaceae bacterium]
MSAKILFWLQKFNKSLYFYEMKKGNYQVLGMMSGTSLDGIDLALCSFRISEANQWSFAIEKAETLPYPTHWQARLKEAVHFSEGKLQSLNEEYTLYLAEVISGFIERHSIKNLDAVCSHGHTILHQPNKGVTLQIGNLPILAEKIQQTVVCDFRVQDVQLGGQGAPLVPMGDQLLFGHYDYCLNLGGFANVSFEKQGKRMAYDICPVNIVMNHYAEKLGKAYDESGTFARSGTINERLLEHLSALPFYSQEPPKSLGLEWVLQCVFPLLEAANERPQNVLRTFVEHVAFQLSKSFEENTSVLITGGGAYNPFLIERFMAQKLLSVEIPGPLLIEYKEAMVFGLLGVLKLRGETNCLASVTGARQDHCSGQKFKLI